MFLIDLNHMYVKIVNGHRVWIHDAARKRAVSDIEFMKPDNELVHVRRGRQVRVMPLAVVHEWLWPFGPFDAHDDAYPAEYVEEVWRRREPVKREQVSTLSDYIPF